MNSRHRGRWTLAACSAALMLLSDFGCARSGSMLANGPKRGSIRENLSRLEFQNRRLREELETARQESDRLAGDLQHSEIDNRRLEAKVDRYRMQLGADDNGGPVVGAYEPLRPNAGDPSHNGGSATIPAARGPSRAPLHPDPQSCDDPRRTAGRSGPVDLRCSAEGRSSSPLPSASSGRPAPRPFPSAASAAWPKSRRGRGRRWRVVGSRTTGNTVERRSGKNTKTEDRRQKADSNNSRVRGSRITTIGIGGSNLVRGCGLRSALCLLPSVNSAGSFPDRL